LLDQLALDEAVGDAVVRIEQADFVTMAFLADGDFDGGAAIALATDYAGRLVAVRSLPILDKMSSIP
jgi:hypothetical protein